MDTGQDGPKKGRWDMQDLSFKRVTEGFNDKWPSIMRVENTCFTVTLIYADPEMNGYRADLKAGRLQRRHLLVHARPKNPLMETSISSRVGEIWVSFNGSMPALDPDTAERYVDDILRAAKSAKALDAFLHELFPAGAERT